MAHSNSPIVASISNFLVSEEAIEKLNQNVTLAVTQSTDFNGRPPFLFSGPLGTHQYDMVDALLRSL